MSTVILEVNKHFFKYCIFLEIDIWTSNHACSDVFFTGYQGHVIQMRAHNWLITLCGINEFENEHSNTSSSERCWDKFKFIARQRWQMFRQFGNCNSPFGDPNHSKMIVELIQKTGL